MLRQQDRANVDRPLWRSDPRASVSVNYQTGNGCAVLAICSRHEGFPVVRIIDNKALIEESMAGERKAIQDR